MANYCRTNHPMAYMLTWTTYGTWLHGNKSGSIDRTNTAIILENKNLETFEKTLLKNEAFIMNSQQQHLVLRAILDVCQFRGWGAYAVHVRTRHIHAVVSSAATPEKVMNDLKIYATRALRKDSAGSPPQKLWTRHGSTKYLWNEQELAAAVNYVRDGQGNMTAFGENILDKAPATLFSPRPDRAFPSPDRVFPSPDRVFPSPDRQGGGLGTTHNKESPY